MGTEYVRRALEVALAGVTPHVQTAWENTHYKPRLGVPFQQVKFFFAQPENPTIGGYYHRENGFLEIKLKYPLGGGSTAANARASLIRDLFHRGATFEWVTRKTIIERTPEIEPGRVEDGRYVIKVSVRFFAHIRTQDVIHTENRDDTVSLADTLTGQLYDGSGMGAPQFGQVVFGGAAVRSFDITPDTVSVDEVLLSRIIDGSGMGVPQFGQVVFGGSPVVQYIVDPETASADDNALLYSMFGSSNVGQTMFGETTLGG